MTFAEKFINGLNSNQINSLYNHYEKFICKVSPEDFVTFTDWVNSYEDLPNILRSMC